MTTWCRQYKIVDDRTDTVYSRYSEDYHDDTLWKLEEGKYWLNAVPFKMGIIE